jgi:hypothetical protein
MSYEEMRCKLAEVYGWSFRDIDDMSFEQIDSAWRGGKKDNRMSIDSFDDVKWLAENSRKVWGY